MTDHDSFWEFINKLVARSHIVIDRPKGTAHPRFPSVIYPVDYGHLGETTSMDGYGIDVWKGTNSPELPTDGVLWVADLLKRDSEIKILLGCTEDEIQTILSFTNRGMMRGLLIRRKEYKPCDP
jgi:inorganic pyrophosphatase